MYSSEEYSQLEAELYPEHKFKLEQKLITVDAADGSGKGAYSESLRKQLSAKYGDDKVILVQPTRFEVTEKSRALYEKLKQQPGLKYDSVRHNLHFMAALMVNYRDLIAPALADGKIVIVDSSEIRSLAFMLDRGTDETVHSTLRWIKSGRATAGIAAGNRIFIESTPQDCLANIAARGKTDYGDPTSIDEAIKRYNCYVTANRTIYTLKQDKPSNLLVVNNPRIESSNVTEHIDEIVRKNILPRLIL